MKRDLELIRNILLNIESSSVSLEVIKTVSSKIILGMLGI